LAQFIALHHDSVFGLLPPSFAQAGRRWKDALVVELVIFRYYVLRFRSARVFSPAESIN